MLNIRNICKTYHVGSTEIKALNNVSIDLPEKGLVFILGKSGSGKTTLLNIIGGLDRPDSGELLFYGKNIVEFTEREYDSYRNSSLGFIFQDYNVLEEFSVEENIALAIELQGHKRNEDKIRSILEQVELFGFEKRKVNTLSGGQKQRIAIARALIKDPKLILADEPSGALDSETGKQIYNILKKLSEEKLIIVVSHDLDFAQRYADRIITLKDGAIIRDKKRGGNSLNNEWNSRKIEYYEENLRKGTECPVQLIKKITSYVKEYNGQINVVCNGDELYIKRLEPIVFSESVCESEHIPEIKAPILTATKFPAKYAAKIGLSNIKQKPIRFILTVLLTTVSLVLFSVLSTFVTYNSNSVLFNAILNSDYSYLKFDKKYYSTDNSSGERNTHNTRFAPNDIIRIKDECGTVPYGVMRFNDINLKNNITQAEISLYYSLDIDGFCELDPSNISTSWQLVCGKYPQSSYEIMITDYTFESIKNVGEINVRGETVVISDYEDMLGIELDFNGADGVVGYVISGIIEVGDIPIQYNDLKELTATDNEINQIKYRGLQDYLQNSLQRVLFVNESFYEEAITVLSSNYENSNQGIFSDVEIVYTVGDGEYIIDSEFHSIGRMSDNEVYSVNYFDNQTSFEVNDIVISINDFVELCDAYLLPTISNQFPDQFMSISELLQNIIADFHGGNSEVLLQKINEIYNIAKETQMMPFICKAENMQYYVRGVFFGENFADGAHSVLLTDELYDSFKSGTDDKYTTHYQEPADAKYDYILIRNIEQRQILDKILNLNLSTFEDDSFYQLDNILYDEATRMDELFTDLSSLMLICGGVSALFSIILMFYFMMLSIANKQYEIGVLRSLGCRIKDVFRIFFFEAVIIAIACFCLSVGCAAGVCFWVNSYLVSANLMNISILGFGLLQVLVIFAIVLFVSFFSTFFSLLLSAKKNPIDILRKAK